MKKRKHFWYWVSNLFIACRDNGPEKVLRQHGNVGSPMSDVLQVMLTGIITHVVEAFIKVSLIEYLVHNVVPLVLHIANHDVHYKFLVF